MRGHLNPEAMIDLAEGGGGGDERRHLEACGDCRAQVEDLREGLGGLASVEVPEPSPFYWEAFRRQVGGRLESEAPPARWSSWWLPGLAAAAALLAAVLLHPPATSLPSPAGSVAMLPAWTPLPAGEQDEGLPVLQGLAAKGELTACGDLGGCLAELSDEDAAAVTAALRSEIEGRSQS
jgi:hypothetical protein